MKTSRIAYLAVLFALSACKENKDTPDTSNTALKDTTAISEVIKHWTYQGETGPEHWSEIEKDSECNGVEQSPINIVDLNAVYSDRSPVLKVYYASLTKIHDVTNNGHTLQYNFDKNDSITLDGTSYQLKQIHFHEASEHTINGVRYPLEIHMVHLSSDNHYAVLSILAEEGEDSAPFQFLESYLPLQQGETKEVDMPFDLNQNLPKNHAYYSYVGSLTTPPCTQGVRWFVFKDPITVSLKQVEQLRALMPLNNYRNEQPLEGRTVLKTFR